MAELGQERVDEFSLNAMVVIESLPAREAKTGRELHGYVSALVQDHGLPLDVYYKPCGSRDEAVALIESMYEAAEARRFRPLLHIEAHGGDDGLFFEDESVLSWHDFCDVLRPLNLAMGHRLPVVVAACFGISVTLGIELSKPAPCQVLIGPSHEIDPGEVLGRFRAMYRTLFTSLDVEAMMRAVSADPLQQGSIVLLSSTGWFEMLMTHYLEEHATPAKIKEFALRYYITRRAAGEVGPTMTELKRMYRENAPQIVRTYFEAFHMYEQVPGARRRFEIAWPRVADAVRAALSKR